MLTRKRKAMDTVKEVVVDNLIMRCHMRNKVVHRDDDVPAMVGVLKKHKKLNEQARLQVAKYMGWYDQGKHHRENGLPAEVWCFALVREAYWVHGKRHRELPLPAVLYADGSGDLFVQGEYRGTILHGGLTLVWYKSREQYAAEEMGYGPLFHVPHRTDGPAIIRYSDHVFGTVKQELWKQENRTHRAGDQPACIDHETGVLEYFHNGLEHRDQGLPSRVDDLNREYEYRVNGELHRVDGPAKQYPLRRVWQWYLRGQPHREDGPWSSEHPNEWRVCGLLSRDLNHPAVSTDTAIEYRVMGELYRTDGGPAEILYPNSSNRTETWYMEPGRKYRPYDEHDLPARVQTGSAEIISRTWYQLPGKQYRLHDRPSMEKTQPQVQLWTGPDGETGRARGPAVVYGDEEKQDEYWINGVRISQGAHKRVMGWITRFRHKYKAEEHASLAGRWLVPVKAHLFNLLV